MARNVKVSTISMGGVPGGPERLQRARRQAVDLLEQAALDQPDIVCLPETFTGLGCGQEEWIATAEEVPGPTTEAVGAVARKHGMYVVCPLVQRVGGVIHNSSILLDRQGEPAGAYHKIHPTIGEIETGITPGVTTNVLETDFGRVGFAICYDLNFRDVAEGNAAGGAEIVFFPSMYRGGLQLQIWAHDFSWFVVSSYSGAGSNMADPLGRMLGETNPRQPILTRALNLDRGIFHIDENHEKWAAIKQKYGPAVELDIAVPEAIFALISHHPEVTVEDIEREFELERRSAYFDRANRVREEALRPVAA